MEARCHAAYDKRAEIRGALQRLTWDAFGGPTIMMCSTLCPSKAVSCSERLAALRATDWLSLGAAPTFAFMAALTGILVIYRFPGN
jgi:hypothetical protein